MVYGVAVEGDNVWAATTAGCSRYNTKTREWAIFNEKNAPMEEIWNYSVSIDQGKVYLGVWGSGCLEYDLKTAHWKEYVDPDGEMEIDLYRDDGIVHVIVTGASHVEDSLWISTYFGNCRYDGRHWRGFYANETGIPSDFTNVAKGRSSAEGWFGTDKGLGVVADFFTDTYEHAQTEMGPAMIGFHGDYALELGFGTVESVGRIGQVQERQSQVETSRRHAPHLNDVGANHVSRAPERGDPAASGDLRLGHRAPGRGGRRASIPLHALTTLRSALGAFCLFEPRVARICLGNLRYVCSDYGNASQVADNTSVRAGGVLSVGIPRFLNKSQHFTVHLFRPWRPGSARGSDGGPRRFTAVVPHTLNLKEVGLA